MSYTIKSVSFSELVQPALMLLPCHHAALLDPCVRFGAGENVSRIPLMMHE